jgi:hypothetical protein
MKKIALLSLLMLSLNLHAAEREWTPYKKLVEGLRLDRFYALPVAERDRVNLFLKVQPVNKAYKPSDVVLTVVDGNERTPLPALTPDFRLAIGAPNPKWMRDEVKIMTSLPKEDKTAVNYEAVTPLPEGLQWSYTTVMGSVGQMNKAIKKMAGAMSLFAPSVDVVLFKFDKPAQLTVGTKVYNTNAKHEIALKPESDLMKANPTIVASARPFEAELRGE